MQGDVLTVERVIAAAPEAIFALLSDASKHPLIDGSGSVKEAKEPSQQLALGATFRMSMKLGVTYSTLNTVVEFEPDRRIAWQTGAEGLLGKITAGRIWRYELEPVDGGTRVRESWDVSKDKQRRLLKIGPTPKQTERNMEKTLERIEEVLSQT